MLTTFSSIGDNITWHIGEKKTMVIGILSIQADGDELDYIITNFTNIPHHKTARVQTWFGDMATFIYTNL